MCTGGAVFCKSIATLRDTSGRNEMFFIRSNTFEGNRAARGGALRLDSTDGLTIASNTFRGNTAQLQGGALHLSTITSRRVYLRDNLFAANAAGPRVNTSSSSSSNSEAAATAAVLLDTAYPTYGGGMFVFASVVVMQCNVLDGNSAQLGECWGSGAVFWPHLSACCAGCWRWGGLKEHHVWAHCVCMCCRAGAQLSAVSC